MLKKRLIATLIVRDGIVVQSINFRRYLPVGSPAIAAEFLNTWGIDEIVLLDISATNGRKDYSFVKDVACRCFVPLTVGGGIRSIEDIQTLLHLGADKICINTHALVKPDFIQEAAHIFGNQCVVVSIDASRQGPSQYRVQGTEKELSPVKWAQYVQTLGAGEIYLTSVDRDGSKQGLDLDLINVVTNSVNIPVIASGGAGHAGHLLEVFEKTRASAVSAANFFHFSEHSVITAKSVLNKHRPDVRLNTHADYAQARLNEEFRLEKQPEDYLDDLMFTKIAKETI